MKKYYLKSINIIYLTQDKLINLNQICPKQVAAIFTTYGWDKTYICVLGTNTFTIMWSLVLLMFKHDVTKVKGQLKVSTWHSMALRVHKAYCTIQCVSVTTYAHDPNCIYYQIYGTPSLAFSPTCQVTTYWLLQATRGQTFLQLRLIE